jgi:glycosyltransferase involved in cell wall biosynthesis
MERSSRPAKSAWVVIAWFGKRVRRACRAPYNRRVPTPDIPPAAESRPSLKVCQMCAVDFTYRHFLITLVDAMRARGWRVEGAFSPGAGVAALRERGYVVHAIAIARSLDPLAHLASLARITAFLRRGRFDLLHVHTPVAALLGRVAGRLAGVPMIVYTAHGFYFHDGMPAWQRRLHMRLEWFAGRFTDLLFTQSAEDAATAVAAGFLPAANVVAIGNGVDPARFPAATPAARAAARAALGIPSGARVVGMVGRLVAEKGYPEFFSAARALAAALPDAVFVAIGERLASDHAGRVDAELDHAKAALGERLILPGLRDDVAALLPAFDLFTLPSHREGMPRTIIEAMMTGLPVVATNIRGSREEVAHGETGLLVPVRDPPALAAAWRILLDDPGARARMGAAGRARALALYDENVVVQRQIDEIRARLPAKLRERA